MSASYLIFDFDGKEDAAQHAFQRIESWRQSFRLGNKLAVKFERPEIEESKRAKSAIQMVVRVDFSDHEKLSRQRWLERIPADELFKPAKVRKVFSGDADYDTFESKFADLPTGIPEKRF